MPTTDRLLDLYADIAQPMVDYAVSTLYQGSTVLDLMLKKKASELKRKNLLKDGLLKLPTFSGYKGEIFLDNDVAMTDAEVESIWVNTGDSITDIPSTSAGTMGQVFPAEIHLSVTTNKTRLQQIEDLMRRGATEELKNAINADLAKFIADLNFGIANAVYNGKGGDVPDFASYNALFTWPINLPNGGTLAKPTKRQIEGLWTFALNKNVTKLYGIDITQDVFYSPNFYDFVVAANQPWGYVTKFPTGITKASELVDYANSMSVNVPVVIDILKKAISDMKAKGAKPDVILCRRNLYDVVSAAITSLKIEGAGGREDIDWLMENGYPEYQVIDGVALIPDDTSRKLRDGTITYACPANAFVMLQLDDIKFMAHKDYNFITTPWEKDYQKIGVFRKQFDATIKFYVVNRNKHALVQFGDIDYNA